MQANTFYGFYQVAPTGEWFAVKFAAPGDGSERVVGVSEAIRPADRSIYELYAYDYRAEDAEQMQAWIDAGQAVRADPVYLDADRGLMVAG